MAYNDITKSGDKYSVIGEVWEEKKKKKKKEAEDKEEEKSKR